MRICFGSVSIHAPARGATVEYQGCVLLSLCFNPRAREGRDCAVLTRTADIQRFNPRAREGRDQGLSVRKIADALVSIHAPARGATLVIG